LPTDLGPGMYGRLVVIAVLLPAAVAGADVAPAVHVDIAAVAASRHVEPVDGITSAGQPDAGVFKVFADAGYVAVIDLRGAGEDRGLADEAGTVRRLGMEYVSLPIEGGEAINFANARRLDALLSRFDGPVLVHCASGNRVGALLALRKSLHGADDEEAIEYGLDAGLTRAEGLVRQRLKEGDPRE